MKDVTVIKLRGSFYCKLRNKLPLIGRLSASCGTVGHTCVENLKE